MKFQKAQYTDIEDIMQIIKDGQIAISKLNIAQWQNGYPSKEIIENDIKQNFGYVLLKNDEIVGYTAVVFNNETTYNKIEGGKWLSNEEFVVAHRLAIKEIYKKQGIATILLHEIANLALTQNIQSFKIDTHEGNILMLKLLKKCGFQYCGIIYLENGDKRLAFERLLARTGQSENPVSVIIRNNNL